MSNLVFPNRFFAEIGIVGQSVRVSRSGRGRTRRHRRHHHRGRGRRAWLRGLSHSRREAQVQRARRGGPGRLLGGQGAFTGEVAMAQIADAGARYVIIGHSSGASFFPRPTRNWPARPRRPLPFT